MKNLTIIAALLLTWTTAMAVAEEAQEAREAKGAIDAPIGAAATMDGGDAAAYTGKNPVVRMRTNLGDLTIELYPESAPKTVANFLDLVKSDFYDGLIFHRVIIGFVIQMGGYDANMIYHEPGRTVVNESFGGLPNKAWTLSMARTSDPDSAGSQFYINMRDNPHLDAIGERPGYTVFGALIDGRLTAKAIEAVQTHTINHMPDVPVQPVIVTSAEVVHEGEG